MDEEGKIEGRVKLATEKKEIQRYRSDLLPTVYMNLPRFTGHQVKSYNKKIGGSNNMETNRRQFSEEFKRDAVEHSLTSEKTVEEVAQDLGIAHSNLRRWRAQYSKNGELAFQGNGRQRLTPQEEEIRRLKKELYDVKQERDILKKALAIFTKKP